MKISAGSSKIGGPLCIYDENGDPLLMMNSRRKDKERIALEIVKIVNDAGGIEIESLLPN
jgi:hypothetical protein